MRINKSSLVLFFNNGRNSIDFVILPFDLISQLMGKDLCVLHDLCFILTFAIVDFLFNYLY